MTVDIRKRDKPASLSVRVTLAEQRVLAQRKLVRTRIALLGRILRKQAGSPAALLWGGGLGFAVAELSRRPVRAPGGTKQPRAPQSNLIDKALKLMTFVRTLSGVFPAGDAPPEYQRASDLTGL